MKILSQFESRGNIELLSQKPIAVFASQKTPEEIYKRAQNVFLKLCELPVSLAGGWQAPLERKLLQTILPAMQANIIYYSARDISKIKMMEKLTALETENKLLVVSAQSRQIRPSQNDIDKRDRLIFSQVSKILFMHVSEGGRLEKYFNSCLQNGLPVYILDHPLNKSFTVFDTVAVNEDNVNLLML